MSRRKALDAAIIPVGPGAALSLSGLIQRLGPGPSTNKAKRARRTSAHKTFTHLIALLLLASLACSFADNLINGGGFQEVNGPILAVVTAASLDPQGQLVGQSTSFPPTAPQMTVVVQVGPLTSPSLLTVAWYSVADAGDIKLFEHTIQVDSLDRAYSVGQNPAVLATGTYKAVATLGSATQTITWTVAEIQASPSTSTSSTSNAAQTQSGKAPTSGTSGKVPAASQAASGSTPAGGCSPSIITSMQIPPEVFVTAWVPTSSQCMSIPSLELQVQVGTNPPKTVCSGSVGDYKSKLYPGQPNLMVCESTGDPCNLNGGSDLPGTVLTESVVEPNGGQVLGTNSLTLYPDKVAPRVTLTTTPSNGVKVKAGDKIQLTGIAEEVKDAGWQTGVQRIEIWQETPVREQKLSEASNSKAPQSCASKSWYQKTSTFTFTVPNNPPAEMKFCAYGYDFTDNEGSNCATFYTGLFTIKGSVEFHSDTTEVLVSGGIIHNKEDLVANFTASGQPDHTMTGTEQVTFNETTKTDTIACKSNWMTGNINWNAVLNGTFQNNSDGSLTVKLQPSPFYSPPYPSDSCHHGVPITASSMPVSSMLVNGKSDARYNVPLPSNVTGYSYSTEHVEMVLTP